MKADDYPKEYREIFKRALSEDVVLQFSTHGKAKAFRAELYHYRYAVRDELPVTHDLFKNLMRVELSVSNKTLTIRRKKRKYVEKLNVSSST